MYFVYLLHVPPENKCKNKLFTVSTKQLERYLQKMFHWYILLLIWLCWKAAGKKKTHSILFVHNKHQF